MSDQNTDVTNILSAQELDFIVRAFNKRPDALTDNARNTITFPYPPAGDAVRTLADYFFVQKNSQFPMDPARREQVIITALSVVDMDAGFLLAVHFYWGLATGLKPKEIAETILLAATYGGIPRWAVGIHKFRAVLTLLKAIVNDAEKKAKAKVEAGEPATFDELMLAELDPPAVAGVIRKNMTFASLDQVSDLERLLTAAP